MKAHWIIPAISLMLILPTQVEAKGRYEEMQQIIPYEDLDKLEVEIEIGAAELFIGRAQENNLFEAEITYNAKHEKPEIRFKKSGKVGYLTIKSKDRDEDNFKDRKSDEHWELLFSPRVPISFKTEIGLVDGDLDMTGLKVVDLHMGGGLSDINLTFDEPNSEEIDEIYIEVGLGEFNARQLGHANFHKLTLENGLGSAKLNLSGQWRVREAEIKLEVGLGSARIEVPEDIGVEVLKEDNFLSSVNLDRALQKVRKELYRTANWEDAPHRVSIEAEVGLGSVKVKIID